MKRRLIASMIVMVFIVQGCSISSEPAAKSSKPESATPLLETPTPTVLKTDYPTVTFTSVPSPSPIITNTPLSILSPAETVQPACFTLLPALPDANTYHGKIVFLTKGNNIDVQNSHLLASLYDLNTRQSKPMHPEEAYIQVSPDGLTYAVRDNPEGKIKFFSTNGKPIRTLLPGKYPYGLDHWLSNSQIALNILQPWGENNVKFPVDQVIYNPFNAEQKTLISDKYPDIDKANALFWEGGSTTNYDPLMTRVVYPGSINKDYLGRNGMGYVLWDLQRQKKLVEIEVGDWGVTPKWAPDGSRFVFNDNYGDGEFYAVTRDGVVTQLSHLNPNPTTEPLGGYFSEEYSWSPDGRYLAFWLETYQNSSYQGTLAILDTDKGIVTNTCISAGFENKAIPYLDPRFVPIWSPDGKYLVTEANRREDGSYQSILIDLKGN